MEAGIRPLRSRRGRAKAVEAEHGRVCQDKAVEAEHGCGGRDKAVEAGIRSFEAGIR